MNSDSEQHHHLWQHQFEAIDLLRYSDGELCALANKRRLQLCEPPTQSFFRVYALLLVELPPSSSESSSTIVLIDGTNAEQANICGAICAERTALVKLRFLSALAKVIKIIIVTDNSFPISPGLLCREYIMSVCASSTSLVLASFDNNTIVKCTIGSIHPFPYLYRYQKRNTIVPFAQKLSQTVLPPVTTCSLLPQFLYDNVKAVLNRDLDNLHPLRFAAAVLFADQTFEVAWQLKGLEYGCSLDPVSQLLFAMEKRRYCEVCSLPSTTTSKDITTNATTTTTTVAGNTPILLLMIDQFGVAHAPFAQARALLSEHRYGNLQVIVHKLSHNNNNNNNNNGDDDVDALITATASDSVDSFDWWSGLRGEVVVTTVDALTPQPGGKARLLKEDDFTTTTTTTTGSK